MARAPRHDHTLEEAHLAAAVHLYRHPALLRDLDRVISGTAPTDVIEELADLINDYPHLCVACAGDLLGIAERSGRSDRVLAQFSFIHYMPDNFVSRLPSFQTAIAIIARANAPVIPMGMAVRWRSEVLNGENGQRADAPSTWQFDHLWRAACYELTALEFQSQGLHAAADEMMSAAAHAFQSGVEQK